MEFDDVLNVLLGIAIGIGMVLLYAWYQFQILKSQINHIIDQTIAEKSAIELEIEVDKGVYFCYNNKDKQFVCQGKTATEIRETLQERFPGKAAYLVAGDPVIVAQFKAELEINENSSSV
jgi:MarR-like DNA-binding transcriptional regulator SgrR of sgrS sRNA